MFSTDASSGAHALHMTWVAIDTDDLPATGLTILARTVWHAGLVVIEGRFGFLVMYNDAVSDVVVPVCGMFIGRVVFAFNLKVIELHRVLVDAHRLQGHFLAFAYELNRPAVGELLHDFRSGKVFFLDTDFMDLVRSQHLAVRQCELHQSIRFGRVMDGFDDLAIEEFSGSLVISSDDIAFFDFFDITRVTGGQSDLGASDEASEHMVGAD